MSEISKEAKAGLRAWIKNSHGWVSDLVTDEALTTQYAEKLDIFQQVIDEVTAPLNAKIKQMCNDGIKQVVETVDLKNERDGLKEEIERLEEMVKFSVEFVEYCEICETFNDGETTVDSGCCQECRASKCFANWKCHEAFKPKAQTGKEE